MPMTRMPRKLLTGWALPPQPHQPVANSNQMNWGRSLQRCLTLAELPTDFEEWCSLAQDKAAWRTAVKTASYDPATNQQQPLHISTCDIF